MQHNRLHTAMENSWPWRACALLLGDQFLGSQKLIGNPEQFYGLYTRYIPVIYRYISLYHIISHFCWLNHVKSSRGKVDFLHTYWKTTCLIRFGFPTGPHSWSFYQYWQTWPNILLSQRWLILLVWQSSHGDWEFCGAPNRPHTFAQGVWTKQQRTWRCRWTSWKQPQLTTKKCSQA